jgi:hypothetical protein
MSRRRKPGTFTVIKDVISYVGGWLLIAYEVAVVPPADFQWLILLMGGALVGVPGASQIIAMRTGGQPSASPPEDSSPSLPSSSSNGSGPDR